VRQLHTGNGAVFGNECGDGPPRIALRIVPDAGVVCGNSPFRRYSGGFRHHHARSAHRATAQMDRMPRIGHTVLCGVLAHRRNHDAIAQGQASLGKRFEQLHGSTVMANENADMAAIER